MFQELWKYFNSNDSTRANQQNLKKETNTDIHLIPLAELPARLKTNLERGLDPSTVQRRQQKYGFNRLTPPLTMPRWVKFCQHVFEGFSLLLWVGALLCIIAYSIDQSDVDNLYLSIILVVVVVCSGIFSYMQETKSDAIMDSFNKLVPQQATVIRSGVKLEVNCDDLVHGDIVEIKGGDRVPADVRIIAAMSFKVDNSSLTGESEPVARLPTECDKVYIESRNMAFFSTNCIEGWARAMVVGIGDNTVMGRIANLTATLDHGETPLAREIAHFIQMITYVSTSMAFVFLLLAVAVGTEMITAVVFFISIIVASVPEGLLATVTVCLSLTAKRMARKNCLVKNLQAVETLGSTSTICSDKTGTLTQNRMTVNHVWVSKTIFLAADIEHSHLPLPTGEAPQNAFEMASLVCCLCSKAEFCSGQENIPIATRLTIGDASESAILKFMEAVQNCDVMTVREQNPKIAEIPFNSTNKFHLTIHRVTRPDCHFLICMKGAPERILDRCSTYATDEGEFHLDGAFRKDFEAAYKQLGGIGERVLGLAHRPLPKDQFPVDYVFDIDHPNFPVSGLEFVGLISMIDPPRPGVQQAVEKCRTAGIKVIMVTGDHPITAKAIAQNVNIIHPNSRIFMLGQENDWPTEHSDGGKQTSNAIVITGQEITDLKEEGLDRVIEHFDEIVFARTSPQQKLIIVESFQRAGAIVAVTGDGVNDSPALKKADIGIAMGITGSDVSKQAADMILLDDNFASIVTGVEEGRQIFDNLKKSIAYTLTSNVPEMAPFLMFILIGIPLGLGTVTILCVDLGTDIIPAISLAYEPAESDIMQRKPRTAKDRLVNHRMIQVTYFYVGIISTAAGYMSYFVIMAEHGFFLRNLLGIRHDWQMETNESVLDYYGQEWSYAARKRLEFTCHTAFFVAIVVTQWFDLLICKTRRNSILHQGLTNEVLNFALIFETGLAIFLCYCPGMIPLLKLYPLKWVWWIFGLPFGLVLFILDEWRRYEIRRHPGGLIEQQTYY